MNDILNSKNTSISEIVKIAIKAFDSSPKHKAIMLCEDLNDEASNIIGVSIVKKEINYEEYVDYAINIDFGVQINK
jgi:PDZ domain-containing secreted protein